MSATFWHPSLKAFTHLATAMQIPHKPLEDLGDIVVLYGPLYIRFYPTLLFLFRKHRDNTTLDRQLT
jgi:hypothetical protein